MILITGIIAGLLALAVRIKINKQTIRPVHLQAIWLVVLAFGVQVIIFGRLGRLVALPDSLVAVLFVTSQLMLLVFAWLNRRLPGGWLLGTGLLLNFLAIILNGGLMPISPETVHALVPDAPDGSWRIGERLGRTKDVVLPEEATRLGILSDRFLLPQWMSYPVAFSLGDVILALGAFWLIFSMADASQTRGG